MSHSSSRSTRARTTLVTCPVCECHVRSSETVCPHCGAGLASFEHVRAGVARWRDARRLLALAALAGIGSACEGKVADDTAAIPAATEADVLGGCAASGPSTKCDPGGCACGPAGHCASGTCVRLPCNEGEYLNQAGECVDVYWFANRIPSSGGCYGCPPRRIRRQSVRAA